MPSTELYLGIKNILIIEKHRCMKNVVKGGKRKHPVLHWLVTLGNKRQYTAVTKMKGAIKT